MHRIPHFAWVMGVVLLLPALGMAAEPDQARDKGTGDHQQGQWDRQDHWGHWAHFRHHFWAAHRRDFREWARGHRFEDFLADRLNLTEQQKRKIDDLRKKTHEEFLHILTPDQRKTLEEMHRGRGERGEARMETSAQDNDHAEKRPAARQEELEKRLDRLMKEVEALRKEIRRRGE